MLKALINTFKFVLGHPLTQGQGGAAVLRVFLWQFGTRLLKMPIVVPWVNGTRLVIERGMVGATGNVYCGLHEFYDMGFTLHFLRPDDLFLDVGANVGTYTVLAAGVAGARVVSFEPIPTTFRRLVDNVNINNLSSLVELKNVGLGASAGALAFSADLDAENHVLSADELSGGATTVVSVCSLDEVMGGLYPTMIKMDVEGFETEVIRGGGQTFGSPKLEAVLIELNGAGARYGYAEDEIRKRFADWGFCACHYDPLTRRLRTIDENEAALNGNTLYIKDVASAQQKLLVANAFSVMGKSI